MKFNSLFSFVLPAFVVASVVFAIGTSICDSQDRAGESFVNDRPDATSGRR